MFHRNGNHNHAQQEEAMMQQLIKELGSNTSIAKATLAEWKAEKAAARHPSKVVSHGEGIVEIPLEDNPYQLRHEHTEDVQTGSPVSP